MAEHSTTIIAINIKLLRETLGLSQKDFAILSGISRSSVEKIEKGKPNYDIDLIDNILSFANFSLKEISSKNFKIADNYRDRLIKKYQNDLSKRIIIESQPKLVFAIKHYLIKSPFLNEPRETKEIATFFRELGWDYSGNAIQIALKRMSGLIEIRKHESKGNTNVYLKKY